MLKLSNEDFTTLLDYIEKIKALALHLETIKQLYNAVLKVNSKCISRKVNAYLDLSTISTNLPAVRESLLLSKHVEIMEVLNPVALAKDIIPTLETTSFENNVTKLLTIPIDNVGINYQDLVQEKQQDSALLMWSNNVGNPNRKNNLQQNNHVNIVTKLLTFLELNDLEKLQPSDFATLKFHIIDKLISNLTLSQDLLLDFLCHHCQIACYVNNFVNTSHIGPELAAILKRKMSELNESIKVPLMLSDNQNIANVFLHNMSTEISQEFYEKLQTHNKEIFRLIERINKTIEHMCDIQKKARLQCATLVSKENSKEAANLLTILQNFYGSLTYSAALQMKVHSLCEPLLIKLKPTPKAAPTADANSLSSIVGNLPIAKMVSFWSVDSQKTRTPSPGPLRRSDLKGSSDTQTPLKRSDLKVSLEALPPP